MAQIKQQGESIVVHFNLLFNIIYIIRNYIQVTGASPSR